MNLAIDEIKPAFSDNPKKRIFGLQINDVDCNSICDKISNAINSKKRFVINYANANTVRLIKKNLDLKNALLNADLVHSDGFGIWTASHFLKNSKLKYRFNFTDCSYQFLKKCQSNRWSLFILGGSNEMLSLVLEQVKKKFPNLNIIGTLSGYYDLKTNNSVEFINSKTPDILWVGMGTPKQEIWICENKDKLDCKVIQSVGDLITYVAGKKRRGPIIIRKLGLEWFVRFLNHPLKYFNRYIVGIPVFTYLLILEILKGNNKKNTMS